MKVKHRRSAKEIKENRKHLMLLARREKAEFPSRGQFQREIYHDACEHITDHRIQIHKFGYGVSSFVDVMKSFLSFENGSN